MRSRWPEKAGIPAEINFKVYENASSLEGTFDHSTFEIVATIHIKLKCVVKYTLDKFF